MRPTRTHDQPRLLNQNSVRDWSVVTTVNREELQLTFVAFNLPATMLKDVLSAVDYSFCAEVALGLFCVAFAMMTYAVIRLKPSSSERYASIPLSDQVQDPRDE